MKVLFLSDASCVHTIRWVNALAERGLDVHLVYKPDNLPPINAISKKVKLHALKIGGKLGYFLNYTQVKNLFRSIRPDIVNAHYASGYGTLARLSKTEPMLLSVWGSDVYEFPFQSNTNMRILLKNLNCATAIASTSNAMAEQVRKLLNDNKREIFITPFGVDLKKFTKKNINHSNEIVIGNIKSLKKIYGIEYLIIAISVLKKRFTETGRLSLSERLKLHLYGAGNLRDELMQLVENLKLKDSVIFKGSIPNDEVPNALEYIDIFCATSNQESFGVSLVEAMAMELPVVATDTPGFTEVVENNFTGIIVERKNPEKIADALEKLILDENLRKNYGQNGRKRVEALYDWEKNVDLMLEVYGKVVNHK